jgi:cell division protein FtsL
MNTGTSKFGSGLGIKAYVLLLVSVTLIFAYLIFRNVVEIGDIDAQITELNAQIADEEKKRADLELEQEKLYEEDSVVELARERLGLVKPDEIIFMKN